MGKRFAVAAVITASVLIGLAGPASADGGQGNIAVTPASGAPNSSRTILANGFQPGSSVSVEAPLLDRTPSQLTADGTGHVQVQGVTDRHPGTYQVRFVGIAPNGSLRVAQGAFSNTSEACLNNPCRQISTLPRTGADIDPVRVAAIAASLLALGFVAFRYRRLLVRGAAVGLPVAALLAVALQAERADAAANGSISGTVTETGGGGLQGVCVQAVAAQPGSSAYFETVTGPGGTYSFTGLENPFSYELGFVDCTATPTHTRTEAFVNVQNGSGVGNVSMPVETVFAGVVTAQADGSPATACLAFRANLVSLGGCDHFTSSGAFVARTAGPGDYIASFEPDPEAGLAAEYSGGAHAGEQATPITAAAGWNVLNVALDPGGSVSGTVTDAMTGDAPTRRVCVGAVVAGGTSFASSSVDEDGDFTVSNIPAGPQKVRFYECPFDEEAGAPYDTQFWNHQPDADHADPVSIAAGADHAGIDAVMTKGGLGNTTTTSSTTSSSTSTSTSTTTPPSSSTSSTSPTSSSSSVPPSSSSTSVPSSTSSTVPGSTSSTVPGSTSSTVPGSSSSSSTTASTALPPAPLPADGAATTSASTAAPGGAVTVSGDGFQAGSTVNAVVYSTPRLLGTLTVDASGRVSGTLTIPSDLAAGDHTIQLQGTGADGQPRVLQSPLTVSAPKSKIPLTGTDARTTALYGLLILAVGLLVRGRQLAGG